MSKQIKWLEIWLDNPSPGEYLLVLRQFNDGSLELLDPQKQYEIVKTFADYEEAVH